MGFSSCKADPDALLRPFLKSNGVENYQCVLLCVGYVLAIMEDPDGFLHEELGRIFTLKEKSVVFPEQ